MFRLSREFLDCPREVHKFLINGGNASSIQLLKRIHDRITRAVSRDAAEIVFVASASELTQEQEQEQNISIYSSSEEDRGEEEDVIQIDSELEDEVENEIEEVGRVERGRKRDEEVEVIEVESDSEDSIMMIPRAGSTPYYIHDEDDLPLGATAAVQKKLNVTAAMVKQIWKTKPGPSTAAAAAAAATIAPTVQERSMPENLCREHLQKYTVQLI
jgi:ACT domain-containing protein